VRKRGMKSQLRRLLMLDSAVPLATIPMAEGHCRRQRHKNDKGDSGFQCSVKSNQFFTKGPRKALDHETSFEGLALQLEVPSLNFQGRIMRLKYTGTGASRGTSALRQPSSSSTPEELTPEPTIDGETPQELYDNILERLDETEAQWAAQLQDIKAGVSQLKGMYEAELKRAAERAELKNAEIETLRNRLSGYQKKE